MGVVQRRDAFDGDLHARITPVRLAAADTGVNAMPAAGFANRCAFGVLAHGTMKNGARPGALPALPGPSAQNWPFAAPRSATLAAMTPDASSNAQTGSRRRPRIQPADSSGGK